MLCFVGHSEQQLVHRLCWTMKMIEQPIWHISLQSLPSFCWLSVESLKRRRWVNCTQWKWFLQVLNNVTHRLATFQGRNYLVKRGSFPTFYLKIDFFIYKLPVKSTIIQFKFQYWIKKIEKIIKNEIFSKIIIVEVLFCPFLNMLALRSKG